MDTEDTVPPTETNVVSKERASKRKQAQKYIDSNDEKQDISAGIRILTELSDNGDTLAAYKLGKVYLNGDIVYKDYDKAESYLKQAAGNNVYAMYTLAKLYLTNERKDLSEAVRLLKMVCDNKDVMPYAAYSYAKILLDDNKYHDTKRALQLLKENADNNSWCSYLLGKLYLFENENIGKDKSEAVKWLKMSVESGNRYAQELLNHSNSDNGTVLANTVVSLLTNLGRIIEEDNRRSRKNISRADRKLLQAIQRKKRGLGIKLDGIDMQYEY